MEAKAIAKYVRMSPTLVGDILTYLAISLDGS